MRTKAALLVLVTATGCATTDAPVEQPLKKMEVAQVGQGSGAEFVACINCPDRTQKVIALPAKPAAPQKPVVAEPQKVREPQIYTVKVHFRWGMASLDKEGRVELVAAIDLAKKGSAVMILGRTDPTGGQKWNERLAKKRAETIRKELIAAGVPEASITAGTHKPCCGGDRKGSASAHREARRADVEITITSGTRK